MHHACADTTGALRSSRTMTVRPLSSVVTVTPGGNDGIFIVASRVKNEVSLIRQNRTGRILRNGLWAIQFTQLPALEAPSGQRQGMRMNPSGLFDDRLGLRLDLLRRPERFAEGVGEIVAILKIVTAVPVGLGEQAGFHHVENNLAKVAAVPDAPFRQHRHHHRAELLQGKLPDAVEQFLAADVPDLAAVYLDDEFLGEMERFTDKRVGLARVTRVPAEDYLHRFVKIDLLH